MDVSRREILAMCSIVPVGFLAAGGAVAGEPACGGTLSLSQVNARRALGYLAGGADAKRGCGLCSYFTAGEGGCGACQMLSGSAVSAGDLCNAFVLKQSGQ